MRVFDRFLLFCALAGILTSGAFAASPSTAWKENIEPDEATQFAGFATRIQEIIKKLNKDGDPHRGFHAKPHGAMSGELKILPGLPEYAQFGMFKDAKTYPCYVRFSNGVGVQVSDARPDVRGFAVKVVGVPGKKLLDGEESALTQDFLSTNSPVSLARNAKQFMAFANANVNQLTLPFTLGRELGAREAARITAFLATSLARPIRSMAVETFWSGAPIKLGPYAVKFVWKPVGADAAHGILPSRDGLRQDLHDRLAKGDLRYDLYLQFFVSEQLTPVEDSSVEWLEKDAPPVKVGELTIAKRDLDAARAQKEEDFVNSLAFSPWHCTEDLRPIGHTMRARKVVYKASSELRRHAPEPTGSEHFE